MAKRKNGRKIIEVLPVGKTSDTNEGFDGQLPPILPALRCPEELSCRVGKGGLRRWELTNRAYSAAVYAHTDLFAPRLESMLTGFTTKLFSREREQLLRLFEQECFAVLGSLQEWLGMMQPIPPAERIVLLKDYQAWMRQVKDLLREAVFAGEPEEWNRDLLHWAQNHKPDEPSAGKAFRYLIKKPVFFDLEYLDKFTELFFAQMELEQQLGVMSGTVLKAYEARIQTKRRVETKGNVTDGAYIPFTKAIELSNGVLTRKKLDKAIDIGEPVKVRHHKPSKQRRRVHIQDVLVLIDKLSASKEAKEEAARMFAEYVEINRNEQPKPNLD